MPDKALVEEKLSHLATRRFPNLAIGDTCVSHLTARIGFIFLAVAPAWAQTPAPAPGATPGSPPTRGDGRGHHGFLLGYLTGSHNRSSRLVLLTRAQSGVGTGPIAAIAERLDLRRSSADALPLMAHL